MTSPSPAKRPTTAWRTDIEIERLIYLIKLGLLLGGLAGLCFIAEILRRKSGVGWVDFFGQVGRQFVMLVPVVKKPFTLGMAVAILIAGIVLWITIEVITPDKPEPENPLLVAPPPPEAS